MINDWCKFLISKANFLLCQPIETFANELYFPRDIPIKV